MPTIAKNPRERITAPNQASIRREGREMLPTFDRSISWRVRHFVALAGLATLLSAIKLSGCNPSEEAPVEPEDLACFDDTKKEPEKNIPDKPPVNQGCKVLCLGEKKSTSGCDQSKIGTRAFINEVKCESNSDLNIQVIKPKAGVFNPEMEVITPEMKGYPIEGYEL